MAAEHGLGEQPALPAKRCTARVLDWLAEQPGDSWQERWEASGADTAGCDWLDLTGASGPSQRTEARYAVAALLVLRVVRPTLVWLLDTRRVRLWDDYACYHDTDLFAELKQPLAASTDARTTTRVMGDLVRICLATGRNLRELTKADFLQARETMRATGREHHTTHSAWFYARQLGLLPQEPTELPVTAGPLSPAQLVDRYGVQDPGIRGVFVDYLTERATDCDYTTLQNLAVHLVKLFWCDLQAAHPGLNSLALTREQVSAWRTRLTVLPDGRQRRGWHDVIGTVRGFYLDLSAWAQEDPVRWAPWVAPCRSRREPHGRHTATATT